MSRLVVIDIVRLRGYCDRHHSVTLGVRFEGEDALSSLCDEGGKGKVHTDQLESELPLLAQNFPSFNQQAHQSQDLLLQHSMYTFC